MVLYFKSRRVLEALTKNEPVYTFRVKKRKKTGRDWVTDRRGGKKKAVVEIEEVGEVALHDLVDYASQSGFGSYEEWVEEIRRLNGGAVEKGWLYRVRLAGRLIVIEGIDGSGKTTVSRFLREELEKRGYDVILLKEPSDSPWGRRIKESASSRLSPEEELELFILDREHNVRHNILPALLAGKVVLLDRYYHSTIAYQGALGFDPEEIRERNEKIAPKPDAVILLDVPPELGVRRAAKRGKLTGFEAVEYLTKVREIYCSLHDITIIDSARPLGEVKKDVLSVVLGICGGS